MPSHKLTGVGAAACLTLAALASPLSSLSAHAAPSSASAVPQGWVASGTQAIDVVGGTLLGKADPHQKLTVSVTLPLRHAAGITARIERMSTPSSPSYGHFLKPAQVLAQYGPTDASVAAVRGYLAHEGFTHLTVAGNHLLVTGTASVAQAERAFHTSMSSYLFHGRKVYANTTPALVPSALKGKVTAVLGLSDFAMTMPHTIVKHPAARPATTAAGSPNLSGFTPAQIAKVYQATGLPAAKHTEIAVVAIGDLTPIIANLRYAEKVEHFPKVPVKPIYTAPKRSIVRNNVLTGNAEWDLDVQMSTMEAKAVKRLDIYDINTFTDPDVARAIDLYVTDDKALELSASLGECDFLAYADGAMITSDEALQEGGLQGQSMFASTGDNGSACPEGASTGVPGGGPSDSWPSDGEYVTAVGGTTLLADANGNVSSELAWVGGGGGVSAVSNAAPWTYQANPAGQAAEYNNDGGRGVPDVSSDADSNTGVLIYTGGKTPEEIGGTSVSSPTVMGLFARLEGTHKNKLGLAPYRFYSLYNKTNPGTAVQGPLGPTYTPAVNPKKVKGLRDVILGTDGGYQARPGWDNTTGVGTPLVSELNTAFGKPGRGKYHRHGDSGL